MFLKTLAIIMTPLRLMFFFIPHFHLWRRLSSIDYGIFGRHFAGYHGVEEDECMLCGRMREFRDGKFHYD